MKPLQKLVLISLCLLLSSVAFGQRNTNYETTNIAQDEDQLRDDSLLAYSDSIYGVGVSLMKQGKNKEAIPYFKWANMVDSLNWHHHWDYSNGILSSPKSWMAYALYGMGYKNKADSVLSSYDYPHSFLVSAETLFLVQPFDRRIYTQKLDSLHKKLNADSIFVAYDRNLAEAELMRKTFGEKHYLYADYLWGLGNGCYNARTALYYLKKAKKIYENSPLKGILLKRLMSSIDEKEKIVLSDSLFAIGVNLYHSGKYEEANDCFAKSYSIDGVPNGRAVNENIHYIERYEYPLLWLVKSLQKMGEDVKDFSYTYLYELPGNARYLDLETTTFKDIDTKIISYRDSLKDASTINFKNGHYEEALKCYVSLKKALDNSTDDNILELKKAIAYTKLGEKTRALNCFKKSSYFYDFAPLDRKMIEPLDSLFELADECFKQEKYGDALRCYDALEKQIKTIPNIENCWLAFLKLQEANAYQKQNKLNPAIDCLHESQQLFVYSLGKYNRWNKRCTEELQDSYQLLGKVKEALAFSKELLDIIAHTSGSNSGDYIAQLAWCAFELAETDNIQEAVKKIEEAISLLQLSSDDFNKNTKFRVYDIANYCYRRNGQYDKALESAKALCNITEGDAYHSTALTFVASNYVKLNEYDKADSVCENAYKEYREQSSDPSFYSSISDVYEGMGENEKALKMLLIGKEENYDKTSRNYVLLLNKIAIMYETIGNLSLSSEYYRQAKDIVISQNGETNGVYALLMYNLSTVYAKQNNFTKAIACIDSAAYVYKLNNNMSSYAEALSLKADFLGKIGKYDDAIALKRQAIDYLKNIYGKLNGNLINNYVALMDLYVSNGQEGQAAILCNNILDSLQIKTVKSLAKSLAKLYRYKGFLEYKNNNLPNAIAFVRKAQEKDEELYGKQSADCINDKQQLAKYLFLVGDTVLGNKMAQQVTAYKERYIDGRFSDLNTNERTLLWNDCRDWFEQMIPMFTDSYTFNDSLSQLAYNAVLYSKGILLSTEQRISDIVEQEGDEIAKETLNQLRGYRLQLNKQYETPNGNYEVSTTDLEKKVSDIERELSLQLKEYANTKKENITWKDVLNNLNLNDAALEFVSFADSDSITYDAYIIKKGFTSPKVIHLFKVGVSETLNKPDVYYSTILSRNIWGRLAEDLDGVQNIYFAPTGDFYSIAIEALPIWNDSTKYVCDKWNLYRLSSTRELVNAKPQHSYTKATVYGGLKYEFDLKDWISNDSTETKPSKKPEATLYTTFDIKSLNNTRGGISELPATYTEAINIDKMLSNAKVSDQLETKMSGTEESFKKLSGKGCDLMHIATHGFYWSESNANKMKRLSFLQQNDNAESRSAEDMALTRSGLLMTGAANSILGRPMPEGAEDGVLTAGEVSQLNLNGLDLVVMSACQTGLGEISGDGVFGLQRGFKKAGANTLLMSLCKVDDNATSLLMSRFYENLLDKHMSKHDAFVDAQKYVRDYTVNKTINVEDDISDADMQLMEQYGEELPEPVNGKVTLTLHPYKDPRFWAVFILVDGNENNSRPIHHQLYTTPSKENGKAANNNFDRWSGKYLVSWNRMEEEGPYANIELHRDGNGYKGKIKLAVDFDPINEIEYGTLTGDITAKESGTIITISLGKFSIKDSTETFGVHGIRDLKGKFMPGDKILVMEYKGRGQYSIKPVGKMEDAIKYDNIETTREKEEKEENKDL